MKTTKNFFLVLMVILGMQSCNLSDLMVVPLKDVEFSSELPISVSGPAATQGMNVSAASKTFSNSGVVNLADIKDIADRLEKVKEMNITQITISAVDFNPSSATVSNFSISFPDLKITKANLIPTATGLSVSFTAAEYASISSTLLAKQPLKYEVSGTVSAAPVTFKIKTGFKADFKIAIL